METYKSNKPENNKNCCDCCEHESIFCFNKSDIFKYTLNDN